MKVVAYARVSSREQEKEGFSIDAQIKRIQEYAERRGIDIVELYIEVESAKKAGRPEFNRMIERVRKEKSIEGILCHKVDRLCRNFKDYVTVDDLGVKPLFVEEDFADNAAGKLTFGMKVLLAKHYVDNLSDEVKKGKREKAEQGHYPNTAPLGYKNNKETRLIDIDPHRSPFVKRTFELYATGNYSLATLRDQLYKEGFEFRPSQPKIGRTSLAIILRNLFYTGDFIFQGKFHKGKHEPLISIGLFEKVQEVLNQTNRPKSVKHQFAFSGLMTCGQCGCSITPQIQKGKYIYYHCSNGKGKCGDKYIREEVLAEQFKEALQQIQVKDEALNWIIPVLKSSHQEEIEFHGGRVRELRERYDKLSKRIDLIYEDKLDGKIPEELWLRKHEEYKTEMNRIEESLRQHKQANFDYVECGIQLLELAKNAYSEYMKQSIMEQRRILNFVLSNCTLKGEKVCYDFNEPFDLIAQIPQIEKDSG